MSSSPPGGLVHPGNLGPRTATLTWLEMILNREWAVVGFGVADGDDCFVHIRGFERCGVKLPQLGRAFEYETRIRNCST